MQQHFISLCSTKEIYEQFTKKNCEKNSSFKTEHSTNAIICLPHDI